MLLLLSMLTHRSLLKAEVLKVCLNTVCCVTSNKLHITIFILNWQGGIGNKQLFVQHKVQQ